MGDEKNRSQKIVFYTTLLMSFLMILIFNVFTPVLSDDLFYIKTVSEASNFSDLLMQEYEQYMNWTGRSVCHMLVRIFQSMDKAVFNALNSLAFVVLALTIYWNVDGRKKYDSRVFVLVNLLLWMFGVSFRQTVLWETGACNYLWGSLIIMGFITVYRYGFKRKRSEQERDAGGSRLGIGFAVVLLIFGILAGWCNENTSGGGILLSVGYLILYFVSEKRKTGKKLLALLKPWMITGVAGQVIGLAIMVLAPGNAVRAGFQEEEHSGLFAYVSRFQKINLAIKDEFLILLIILAALMIIVWHQNKKMHINCQKTEMSENSKKSDDLCNSDKNVKCYKNDRQFGIAKSYCEKTYNGLLYLFVFIATCFALVMAPEPMRRAYFGAGIFLTVAVVQFFVYVTEEETIFASFKTGLVAVLAMIMFFTYMECGAHLMRIYREYNERDTYLTQMAEAGVSDVTIPMLRPDFDNKYTYGYESDIQEDPGYWINVAYAAYYGFDSVSGVPREEWTEY